MSCTHIHYQSQGTYSTYLQQQPQHLERIVYKDKVDFYLWGLLPDDHVVNVDKVMYDAGVLSSSRLKITEGQSFLSLVKSIITLGMYIPVEYEIEANAVYVK